MARAEILTRPRDHSRNAGGSCPAPVRAHPQEFRFSPDPGESDLTDRVTIAYYEAIARHYRISSAGRPGRKPPSAGPNMIAYDLIGSATSTPWIGGEKDFASRRGSANSRPDPARNQRAGRWKKPPRDVSFPFPLGAMHSARGTPDKGENTRQAIFRAAERVIGRHGINRATSLRSPVRRRGLGTFYVHFGSKGI